MRRHAKASSAGSTSGQASRLGSFVRGALATRASSPNSDGSGAPSHRTRFSVLVLAIAAFALLAFAPLSQAKTVVGGFGTADQTSGGDGNIPLFGGQFSNNTPRGTAVNNSGVGAARGTVYVVDNGSRIQRFSPTGAFERAFGQDVIATTVDEQQRIKVSASAGTYTLSFKGFTTDPIPFNADPANDDVVRDALAALPSVNGVANVADHGFNPFTVTFQGALGASDQPLLTIDTSNLTGTASVFPVVDGANSATTGGSSTGFEICTVATYCKTGSTSGTTANGGQLNDPQGVAVNQANGHVYVTEQGNRRVSEFDADGNFVRAWGWGVVSSGLLEFGSGDLSGALGVAAHGTSGKAYVSASNLIHVFNAAPTRSQTSTFDGSDTDAGAFAALRRIAVHQSDGTIYAIDNRGAGAVVDKFDSSGAAQDFSALSSSSLDGGDVTAPDGPVTFDLGDDSDIAVDNSGTGTNGRLYVLEEYGASAHTAFAFAPDGTYLHKISPAGSDACGVAVDSGGNVWIADYNSSSVIEYNAAGTATGTSIDTSAQGNPCHIAFDGSDNLYFSLYNGALYKKTATSGYTATTQVDSATTNSVAVDPSTSHVLALHSSIVSEYSDVGFEICTVAADCRQAVAGADGGRFGDTIGYPVTDSSNNVWVPDASNNRIQEFDSSGNFIAAYGYGVNGGAAVEKCISTVSGVCQAGTSGSAAGQFSFGNPKQIAFDSTGNLYALDSGNNRVQKFDPTIVASVSDFGTSTFPTYTTQAPESLVSTSGGTRLVFSVNNDVSGNGERQLLEIDPSDASVKDTSLVGSGLNNVINGLAEDATSGDLYATTNRDFFNPSPRSVIRLSSTPLANSPAIALSPVLVKGETTVALKGTVDPKGGLVSCAFQYSTDNASWTDVKEPDCAGLGENGGIQAIGEAALGLTPNTHYFARLQVSRPLVPGSTQVSSVREFDTNAPPPAVSVVGAFDIQDTTARMGGTIDPKNSPTGYVFEYGTTPALGQSTAPVNVGGGTTPVIVSQLVTGLTPDTTYYFRLRATNASGSTANPTQSFHTRADAIPLPDNRAYEMVSPPNKNGGDVDRVNILTFAEGIPAPDGGKVAFCTASLFGAEPSQLAPKFCTSYLSSRTPGGWETKNLMPRYCYADSATSGSFSRIAYQLADMNLDRFVTAKYEPAGCPISLLDPAAPFSPDVSSPNLYLQDPSGDINDPSSFHRLGAGVWGDGIVAGSADMSHVFFLSVANQTPSPDSPAPGSFYKLYEWVELGPDCGLADPSYRVDIDACLRLASVRPDGTPFTVNSNYPPIEFGASINLHAHDAVSRDGRRLYFQSRVPTLDVAGLSTANPACSINGVDCQLYMREDGATTFRVSQSECTVGCDPIDSSSVFEWATPDGSVALFTSGDKLSNDGIVGTQLYRWDRDAAPGSRLTSLGNVGAPIGVSDDGDTVYTYNGFGDAPAIHRWQWNGGSPTSDVLASTAGASGQENFLNKVRLGNATTPDGRYLLLRSPLQLDPAADKDTDHDIYRWDEENGWICLSCQLPGVASKGDASYGEKTDVYNEFHVTTGLGFRTQQPLMSPDGKRVFFSTPDALVPEDTNGEAGCPGDPSNGAGSFANRYDCGDVYEWNDGRISLISPGKSPSGTYLLGADWTNGADNVFFYTRERLVGWDTDNNTDIYDARVGGGFPEPPATGAPCESDACRGAGSTTPNVPGAGSGVFQGPGNPPAKHTHPKKKHPKKHHHHKRAHHRAANHNRRAAR